METFEIESLPFPILLSRRQLREFPPRIKRLRKVAHFPSRPYGMLQVFLNLEKAKVYWNNLLKTDPDEYFRQMDENRTDESDLLQEMRDKLRRQKPKGYTYKAHSCSI